MSIRNVMKPDHFMTYCKRCGTRYEFDEDDIRSTDDWTSGEVIDCPHCGFTKVVRGMDEELTGDIQIVWADTMEAYT